MTDQISFLLFNYCLSLVPLTLQIVIFRTSTFWTSILAFFVFREKIIPFEILSMLICFAAMVTMTVAGARGGDEPSETEQESNFSSS